MIFILYPINTYIELQGFWSHGKHPFDSKNQNDIDLVNKWKQKINEGHYLYNASLDTWTVRDILKRNKAKENNLNYIEIFNYKDIDNVKSKLLSYKSGYMII